MTRKIFLTVLLILTLISCLGFAYEEHLTFKYFITANDNKKYMSITYQEFENLYALVIHPKIIAAGCNEDFIIAKREHRVKKKNYIRQISYYIIPDKEKISKLIEKNYIGPMTLKEFK